jgi:hypothetical protein
MKTNALITELFVVFGTFEYLRKESNFLAKESA